jgi:hypothetical protein
VAASSRTSSSKPIRSGDRGSSTSSICCQAGGAATISCTSGGKSGSAHSRTSAACSSWFGQTSATADPFWCESVSRRKRLGRSGRASREQTSRRADKPVRAATPSRGGSRVDLLLPTGDPAHHSNSNVNQALSVVQASPDLTRVLASLRGQA